MAVADPEGQIDQALANLDALLRTHGMGPADIVKAMESRTDPGLVGAWRATRDMFMQDHKPTSTLLVVADLASPDFMVGVEAETAD